MPFFLKETSGHFLDPAGYNSGHLDMILLKKNWVGQDIHWGSTGWRFPPWAWDEGTIFSWNLRHVFFYIFNNISCTTHPSELSTLYFQDFFYDLFKYMYRVSQIIQRAQNNHSETSLPHPISLREFHSAIISRTGMLWNLYCYHNA